MRYERSVHWVSSVEDEPEECCQGSVAGVNSEDIIEVGITGDREKAVPLECWGEITGGGGRSGEINGNDCGGGRGVECTTHHKHLE